MRSLLSFVISLLNPNEQKSFNLLVLCSYAIGYLSRWEEFLAMARPWASRALYLVNMVCFITRF